MREARYVREKRVENEENILTVMSMIQLLIKNSEGQVIEVRPQYVKFEEFELDNLPFDISNLPEIDILLNREEFDHLQYLYENSSTEYIRFQPIR